MDYSKYNVDLLLFEDIGDYSSEIPEEVNILLYDITKTYGPFCSLLKKSLKDIDFSNIYIRIVLLLKGIFGQSVIRLLRVKFRKFKKYDCAIAYRVGFCSEFVAYVINSPNKITWWHHGEYNYNEKQTKELLKTYSKFNSVVTVTEGCKELLIRETKIDENKIKVIPNIIDERIIWNKAKEVDVSNEKDDTCINIVSIGRLSYEKGMINCVYVCKKLIDTGYKIKWIIIGDGPEYVKIKNEIEKNKLEGNLFLKGKSINPYPYLAASDIFVHPSYVESMSITALEAMCLQIPSVIAESIGPKEFITNFENGILVEPTIEGLYNGVLNLVNDKKLSLKISTNNDVVLKNYSSRAITNKVYNLIEM